MTAEAEVLRLTLHLHEMQKHPDFLYCMTFEENKAPRLKGWEPNPALIDAHHGNPGGAAHRHPHESRQLYWMKRQESL